MKHNFTVSVPINDRRRAMLFYRNVLDLRPVGAPSDDGIPEPLQFAIGDSTLLALIPADGLDWVLGEQPLAPPGHSECLLGFNAGSDAEVDEIVQRVRDSEGSVIAEASCQDWGYTALCADPDGHVWEIVASSSPS
ncbi:MAG: VOC family protein [Leucobacter sp.]